MQARIQRRVHLLQRCDLRLLLFEGIDEDSGELIVFDTFDLAFVVPKCQQRLDLRHLFRDQADVWL